MLSYAEIVAQLAELKAANIANVEKLKASEQQVELAYNETKAIKDAIEAKKNKKSVFFRKEDVDEYKKSNLNATVAFCENHCFASMQKALLANNSEKFTLDDFHTRVLFVALEAFYKD